MNHCAMGGTIGMATNLHGYNLADKRANDRILRDTQVIRVSASE